MQKIDFRSKFLYPRPVLRRQTHMYCLRCKIPAEYYSENNCSVCGLQSAYLNKIYQETSQ